MQHTIRVSVFGLVAIMAAFVLATLPGPAAARTESNAAPLLAQGAGYGLPRGSAPVRQLQRRLRVVGEAPGPVDGRFGPLTAAAVTRFQGREGVAVDGLVGPKTRAALKRATALLAPGAGYGDARGSGRVRLLQRRLRLVGAHPGPIDGRFGPLTVAAVTRFQRRHGLVVDGLVGKATSGALERQLARTVKPRSEPTRISVPPPVPPAPKAELGSGAKSTGYNVALVVLATVVAAILILGVLPFTARRARWWWRRQTYYRSQHPEIRQRRLAAMWARARSPRRPPPVVAPGPPVLGYASVRAGGSQQEAEDFRVQAEAIASECIRRNLRLLQVVREREPERGEAVERRGLGYTLSRISAGDAEGLVVAEVSRLSRSAEELGQVLDRLSRLHARLIAAAEGLDTAERGSQIISRELVEMGDLERTLREGDLVLRGRIDRMRSQGMSFRAIADRLNEEGVPQVRGGGRWRPSTVRAVVGYGGPPDSGSPSQTPDPGNRAESGRGEG